MTFGQVAVPVVRKPEPAPRCCAQCRTPYPLVSGGLMCASSGCGCHQMRRKS